MIILLLFTDKNWKISIFPFSFRGGTHRRIGAPGAVRCARGVRRARRARQVCLALAGCAAGCARVRPVAAGEERDFLFRVAPRRHARAAAAAARRAAQRRRRAGRPFPAEVQAGRLAGKASIGGAEALQDGPTEHARGRARTTRPRGSAAAARQDYAAHIAGRQGWRSAKGTTATPQSASRRAEQTVRAVARVGRRTRERSSSAAGRGRASAEIDVDVDARADADGRASAASQQRSSAAGQVAAGRARAPTSASQRGCAG
jgi:hypothetical protein